MPYKTRIKKGEDFVSSFLPKKYVDRFFLFHVIRCKKRKGRCWK
jgi:hypothetical protein